MTVLPTGEQQLQYRYCGAPVRWAAGGRPSGRGGREPGMMNTNTATGIRGRVEMRWKQTGIGVADGWEGVGGVTYEGSSPSGWQGPV